jgi:hypothetical protein
VYSITAFISRQSKLLSVTAWKKVNRLKSVFLYYNK